MDWESYLFDSDRMSEVPFLEKLQATLVPKKRSNLLVKSKPVPPYGHKTFTIVEPTDSSSGVVTSSEDELPAKDEYEISDSYYDGYTSPLEKAIVFVVNAVGTVYAFFLMWIILIVWAVFGIIYKAPQTWQIIMQNGQSVQTYIWDSLLMRQQMDDTNNQLRLVGRIKSRHLSLKRMLQKQVADHIKPVNMNQTTVEDNAKLLDRNWFDKLCSFCSSMLGSIPTLIIYWLGIAVWIACGRLPTPTENEPPYTASNPQYGQWTNSWQMYINTATAVELLISSVLLANVRARNDQYMEDQAERICLLDARIESIARQVTGDDDDNPTVEIDQAPRDKIQEGISWYAEVIGNGVGLLISTAVFGAWIAVGPHMNWNDNWQLIIGTYTGLVGYIDGFVLREVYGSVMDNESKYFYELMDESQELLDIAGINYKLKRPVPDNRASFYISQRVSHILSSEWAVVTSVVTVLVLIVIASLMHWNLTAQLICNTPTMIIEGFCLLVLMQAHNWSYYERRTVLLQLTTARELLYNYYSTFI